MGPYSPLCPAAQRKSTPISSISIGSTPALWAQSSAIGIPYSRAMAPIRSTGSRNPHTLEAWVQTISRVFPVRACRKASTVASCIPWRYMSLCPRYPFSRKGLQRPHHCIVLQIGNHHMVSRPQPTLEHQIQRLGTVEGKHHIFGAWPMEEFVDFHPALVHFPGGGHTHSITTSSGIRPQTGHSLLDCHFYGSRFWDRW